MSRHAQKTVVGLTSDLEVAFEGAIARGNMTRYLKEKGNQDHLVGKARTVRAKEKVNLVHLLEARAKRIPDLHHQPAIEVAVPIRHMEFAGTGNRDLAKRETVAVTGILNIATTGNRETADMETSVNFYMRVKHSKLPPSSKC